jgi:hypothetical protein
MLEIDDLGIRPLQLGIRLLLLILQSLHPLLHVVSVLKEFPARLIPIGGLGDVVDFIVP